MRFRILVFFVILLSAQAVSCIRGQQRTEVYSYRSKLVYSNRGDVTLELQEDDRTFSIFMNTSRQTVYLSDVNWPYTEVTDLDGNPKIVLELPPLNPGESATITLSLEISVRDYEAPELSINASEELKDIPEELRQEYCETGGSWHTDNQNLIDLAKHIWTEENTTNVLAIVSALADWVGTSVSSKSHDVPYYPNETYELLEGDCDDQAILLITLCRILGIPAYLQLGCRYVSDIFSSYSLRTYWEGHVTTFTGFIKHHAWAIIYIPPWGWLPFDMTLGWSRLKPLAGITSAPLWKTKTIQMMNYIDGDWVGEARNKREALKKSPLYVYYDYKLAGQEPFLERWLVKTMISTTVVMLFIVVTYFYKKRIKKKRNMLLSTLI